MSSNAWGNVSNPIVKTVNFAEIMNEEYAHQVQDKEMKRYEKEKKREEEKAKQLTADVEEAATMWNNDNVPSGSKGMGIGASTSATYAQAAAIAIASSSNNKNDDNGEWEDYSVLLLKESLDDRTNATSGIGYDCDSDAVIAHMIQSEFDKEYNEELSRIEKSRNKNQKVTVSLDKFRRDGDLEYLHEGNTCTDEEEDDERDKRDWDRFDANEKKLEMIPKCGFKINEEGEMITKHDEELCGVRNACRVMSLPLDIPTGDGAGFDMKLSNKVFNQLKSYARRGATSDGTGHNKKNRQMDRKGNVATAEMGMDAPTRMLLYKLINNQILEQINGIISTGKEAVILHANSDPAYAGTDNNRGDALLKSLPKECAIKIFKTTLNEFKQRDIYIKNDFRFKGRFKQNNRTVINMWAEKEMLNLMRMQSVGINCPDIVVLKKHILVMSFIGDNHNAAPKLKDAHLSADELSNAYEEIVEAMHNLYNEAKLVHADLSEYNILWYEQKCWFIDVAQSVEPGHPSALEFLMRDCGNIITFFKKRGLPNIYTKEQLFEHITSLNAETYNVAMLERIHGPGASKAEATAPNQEECPDELRPLAYPFELAWEKVETERKKKKSSAASKHDKEQELIIIDQAANAMQVLSYNSSVETVVGEKKNKHSVVVTAKVSNTAKN